MATWMESSSVSALKLGEYCICQNREQWRKIFLKIEEDANRGERGDLRVQPIFVIHNTRLATPHIANPSPMNRRKNSQASPRARIEAPNAMVIPMAHTTSCSRLASNDPAGEVPKPIC